jgi:hypothetical protein
LRPLPSKNVTTVKTSAAIPTSVWDIGRVERFAGFVGFGMGGAGIADALLAPYQNFAGVGPVVAPAELSITK